MEKKVKADQADRADLLYWKHRHLLLGALGIFAYVGAEVSIGSFLVNYFGLPEIAGFSAKIGVSCNLR